MLSERQIEAEAEAYAKREFARTLRENPELPPAADEIYDDACRRPPAPERWEQERERMADERDPNEEYHDRYSGVLGEDYRERF